MNVDEMEKNGTIDYYLELTKYIQEFINRNYPLSQDDMRAIVRDETTDSSTRRQEAHRVLTAAMEEALNKFAEKNMQMISKAEQGTYTPYTVSDFEQTIFQMKQYMLGRLWRQQNQAENQVENSKTMEEK